MDRAAVQANQRRRTPQRLMKWQKTRSPFAFSSPRPLRLTLYSRQGAKVDGDRFVTPKRKIGVTAVDMPLVKIGKAAELLGISVQTLRNGRTPVSWFQIGAAKAACATTWERSSGSALRICRLSVMPVSPAITKKMISFVSRNCSKPSVRPKAGVMRSSPISARDLTTKRKAYSDYWN